MSDVALKEDRKAVVFSEFERMTRLAGEELRKLGIGYVSLHRGVPSLQRGALMEKFRNDPPCKYSYLPMREALASTCKPPPWW